MASSSGIMTFNSFPLRPRAVRTTLADGEVAPREEALEWI